MKSFFTRALVLLGLFLVGFGTWKLVFEDRSCSDISCAARWRVSIESSAHTRLPEVDTYDVIIVGAGLGGLSCAASLARQGYRVLMLEAQEHVGGFYTSFERHNTDMSVGVTDVTGCGNPGPVSYLLGLIDARVQDYFTPIIRQIIYRNKKLLLGGDADALRSQLSAHFTREKSAIEGFLREACAVYAESYGETVARFGVPLMPMDFIRAYGLLRFPGYILGHRMTATWARQTFKEKIDAWFVDPELKNFWGQLLSYAGLDAKTTPAFIGVFAVVMPLINGSFSPKGGCQLLVDRIRDFLVSHGATVLTGQRVDKILTDSSGVRGVQVGERIFKSRIVVANVHAQRVFTQLLAPDVVPSVWREQIASLPLAQSAVVVQLGFTDSGDGWVDRVAQLPAHIVDLDGTFHLVITLDPANKTLNMMTFFVESYARVPVGDQEYQAYKQAFVVRALARCERVAPGARHHMVWSEVLTPRSFEQRCGAPAGACYGFDLSHGGKLPSFKTPIRGLYLASASALFGGGVEAVVMTGLTVAHDIMGWRA